MTNKKNANSLGRVKWLKKVREEMGLSQYGMAKKLSMILASYSYLEDKARGCRIKTIVDVKRLTGKSWDEIGTLFEKDTDGK